MAKLLAMEAGLFVPSGTMGNLICGNLLLFLYLNFAFILFYFKKSVILKVRVNFIIKNKLVLILTFFTL